ncbi:MAG: methanogenesis marker 2 protein [Thermoplasmata archaeon]|nr:methanogenesis marker 2 protein [Thermoplasmata archaeon]
MLSELVKKVRDYPGLSRKQAISRFVDILKPVEDFGHTVLGFGDDAAAIKLGDEYILFASDGIWTQLHSDPQWAGYCSVLVNINDIYAMGGRPLALTNNVSFTSDEEGDSIARGIRIACEKFKVAMVAGHTHPDADNLSISVSIIGRAGNLITSSGCNEGDDLLIAIDLDGKRRGEFLNWDSTSHKTSEVAIGQLDCLVELAEKRMVTAGRDISNPGVLGTIGMLLETSGLGAAVDLDAIPAPENIPLDNWVLMYPGYGFTMTCKPEKSREVIRIFQERQIVAEIAGSITEDEKLRIRKGGEEEVLFDFEKDSITGLRG